MTTSALETGFFVSYGLTGVALAFLLYGGRTRQLKIHFTAFAAFAIGFGVVLAFAEMTGRRLKFDPLSVQVHFPCAYAATGLLLAPVVTGIRRYRGSGSLRAHRIAIVLYLTSFVLATVTGVIMLSTGTPVAP